MRKSNSSRNKKSFIAASIAIILFFISIGASSMSKNFLESKELNSPQGLKGSLMDPMKIRENILQGSDTNKRIAVININGVIQGNTQLGPFAEVGYNHGLVLDSIEKAKEDLSVVAIVLKVNSPGGGVYESAEIRDALMDLKQERKIPIYTSMGSMAASGGYYVSAETDKIYASSETITGSIGVIMSGVNYSELLQKLGVKDQTIKSGVHKDIGSSKRPMTESDQEILQNYINSAYSRFVKIVADGRGMTKEEVVSLADGRIYDGQQALSVGLIDKIGYTDTVIKDLTKDLKIKDPQVFEYSTSDPYGITSLFSKAKDGVSGKVDAGNLLKILSNYSMDRAPRAQYLYGGEI
ncbi:MAG: signal peptide peptidase SppA [Peptoniphilaceae bacterium]